MTVLEMVQDLAHDAGFTAAILANDPGETSFWNPAVKVA